MSEEIENNKTSFVNWFGENQFVMRSGIILAAIAIFIVIIIGIISGVGFWRILFRIILGGIIFFALGIGVGFLLQSFIPDISSRFKKSEEYDNENVGDNVDYIADDNSEDSDKEYIDSFKNEDGSNNPDIDKISQKTKEYNIPDDPKMLADAVRTVMKRDE